MRTHIETMDYNIIVHGFRPESEKLGSGQKDTIGKGISRAAEWHKSHARSTFQ